MIGAPIDLLAKNTEAAAERCVFAGKARAGPDVGQIKNEIIHWIRFVLETGRKGEAFAGVEKGEENAATCRRAVDFHETQLAPRISRRSGNHSGEIGLQFRALPADERQCLALRRIEQRRAARINDGRKLDL